jgi:hypothetical protein
MRRRAVRRVAATLVTLELSRRRFAEAACASFDAIYVTTGRQRNCAARFVTLRLAVAVVGPMPVFVAVFNVLI